MDSSVWVTLITLLMVHEASGFIWSTSGQRAPAAPTAAKEPAATIKKSRRPSSLWSEDKLASLRVLLQKTLVTLVYVKGSRAQRISKLVNKGRMTLNKMHYQNAIK